MTFYKPSASVVSSPPLNFYPLSHFSSDFIVNEGEITARKKPIAKKEGFLLEFQEDGKKYVLEADAEYTGVSKKVKNTTLNF